MLASRSSLAARCGAQRAAAAPLARPASRVQLRAVAEGKADTKKKSKKEEEFDDGPEVSPSTAQVQAFLNTLCGDTDIAQIELKMGTFNMKVRRSIEGGAAAAPAAPAPSAASYAAPAPAPVTIMTADSITPDESVDEALVYVASPKVGIFRRGKYAGGKRVGKGDTVKEGDILKKGQVIAYVEQLGTFEEVQAPQAGEVARFRLDDGDPVEYGQTVMELAPFFGGHIIGDSKYA